MKTAGLILIIVFFGAVAMSLVQQFVGKNNPKTKFVWYIITIIIAGISFAVLLV